MKNIFICVCTIINDKVSGFFKYKIIILGKYIFFKNFLFLHVVTYLMHVHQLLIHKKYLENSSLQFVIIY